MSGGHIASTGFMCSGVWEYLATHHTEYNLVQVHLFEANVPAVDQEPQEVYQVA